MLTINNRMISLLTIGLRIAKDFDFLGYCFEPKGLTIAPKTLAKFLDRKTQLYEQGADHSRIGQYVRNWWRWVRARMRIVLCFFIYLLFKEFLPVQPKTTETHRIK